MFISITVNSYEIVLNTDYIKRIEGNSKGGAYIYMYPDVEGNWLHIDEDLLELKKILAMQGVIR